MEILRIIRDWLEDRGPDSWRAAAWSLPITAGAAVVMVIVGGGLLITVVAMLVTFGFVYGGAMLLSSAAGAATEAALQHRGTATPSVADYSYEKSLVTRGMVREAIDAYESHIAAEPEQPAPYLLASDLHVREGDLARGRELLLAVRDLPTAKPADVLHATNRLIDLYLGPLDRPEEARRELRRLVERFPDTQAATHARAALERLRSDVR